MAHAAELSFGTCTVASVDSFPGFSKKSNDKQSDPAKASVNFHGCHGHHIGIPVGASPTPELVIAVKAVPARNGASLAPPAQSNRSEERRVGKECVSTCRSRWSPSH